ncbi:hypothetical protein SASPL_123470 [Salvia splendens]|uniref:Uncharacterized protein n=1 Tax=Salvia splendens TaxID=180675 RepID=A0A8X8XLQ8_SALSN|nr:hypothetical protein SASPL_123470 [Salvia splendens]
METGESEENEGVYEKLEVELDQKLLEPMVYFKDPELRKNCAGRVSETRKANPKTLMVLTLRKRGTS